MVGIKVYSPRQAEAIIYNRAAQMMNAGIAKGEVFPRLVRPENTAPRLTQVGLPELKTAMPLTLERVAVKIEEKPAATKSGELLWSKKLDGQTAPAVVAATDQGVYVASYKKLTAYSATGVEKWSTKIEGRETELIVRENTIYLSTFKGIIAINEADGKIIWKTNLPNRIPFAPPVEENGMLLFIAEDNNLVVINTKDGQGRTEIKAMKMNRILDLSAGEGYICVDGENSCGRKISLIDPNDFRVSFEAAIARESSPAVPNPSIIKNGKVFVFSNNNLIAFDIKTERKLWVYKSWEEMASPIVCDNNVYFIEEKERDSRVVVINTVNGKKQWEYKSKQILCDGISIDDNNIYIRGRRDGLIAISRTNHAVQWSYKTNDRAAFNDMVVNGGTVYAVIADRELHAIRA